MSVRCAAVLTLAACAPLAGLAQSKSEGGEWTCNPDDDFWYLDGVKTEYGSCSSKGDGKEGDKEGKTAAACVRTDPGVDTSVYPEICIPGPGGGTSDGARCFYTHVPAAVKSAEASDLRVPLVIDMHGGGGCAHHEIASSGFKSLADTLAAQNPADSFIVVWPQGYDGGWGMSGSDWDKAQQEQVDAKSGKEVVSTDDLTFLADLVAYLSKSTEPANPARGRVDATKIFATGFSMGCMMSHRLALEKSAIVAGFGCHGGTMIQLGEDVAAEKARFNVQPMPAYLTGGTEDAWFANVTHVLGNWATMNGCGDASTKTSLTLASGGTGDREAVLTLRSSGCKDSASVASLEVTGMGHVPDTRMASMTWDFLKTHTRTAAATVVGPAPASVPPPAENDDESSGRSSSAAHSVVLAAVVTALARFFE